MIEIKLSKMCAQIKEWLQSPEGRAHMEKVGEEIRQMLEDLKNNKKCPIKNYTY